MDYTIQIKEDQNIILATAAGEWDRETDGAMLHQIMETVAATGCRKVLVDIQELCFDFPLIQIFERAQELREQRRSVKTTSTRVAVVYLSQNPKMEEAVKFFETAARNRSLPYRTFGSMDEAMGWLTE